MNRHNNEVKNECFMNGVMTGVFSLLGIVLVVCAIGFVVESCQTQDSLRKAVCHYIDDGYSRPFSFEKVYKDRQNLNCNEFK